MLHTDTHAYKENAAIQHEFYLLETHWYKNCKSGINFHNFVINHPSLTIMASISKI